MTKLGILLVDDHAVVRAGLKLLINAQTDMTVVGESLSIAGRGFNLDGAVLNVNGINRWEGTFAIGGAYSYIGVDPDPDPLNANGLAFDDFS